MLKLYSLQEIDKLEPNSQIILDSAHYEPLYRSHKIYLILSPQDLWELQQRSFDKDIVYINQHKNVNYLSTIIGIANVNRVNLLVYTDHHEYWRSMIYASRI